MNRWQQPAELQTSHLWWIEKQVCRLPYGFKPSQVGYRPPAPETLLPAHLVPMIAGVTKQVVQLSRQVTGVDTPLWDHVTSLASVQAVIDFTHSTRAMLITAGPAPSRLRLPRSRGLGFGNFRSDDSVNAASRPPPRFH